MEEKRKIWTHKKLIIILVFVVVCLVCGVILFLHRNDWMELPENPVAFESHDMDNSYYDADDDDGDEGYVAFAAIEYNNRTYIPYGSLDGMIFPLMEYEECIGYLVDEDDPNDMDHRVYPLKDDPEHNFLAAVLVSGFMEQPFYYRAIDTNGKDIEIPGFIDSNEYDYWE